MRVLFDTSVLVPAIVQTHPQHSSAVSWLQRAHAGEIDFLVTSHCLAELYSVLSTLPSRPKIAPSLAWRLVQDNVLSKARLIPLSPADYSAAIQSASERSLSGGVIFDALIARAAQISAAECLLTFNTKDFRRVWPEGESILLSP